MGRARVLCLSIALSLGCAHTRPLEAHDGSKVRTPATLGQAMRALDRLLDPELIEALRSGEVEAIELHHGLGAGLRSAWGLWAGTSALAVSLRLRGVHHPDDMSALILETYTRRLRGEPRDVRGQIAELERYYEEQDAYYAAEAASGPERTARVEAARMGWTLSEPDPNGVPTLPSIVDHEWDSTRFVQRIEPHAGGVLVFYTRVRGQPPEPLWHAGLYFLAAPEAELEVYERDDCEQIHDMVALGGASHWLCRNGEQWSLVHEGAGDLTREPLELDADALRLAVAGSELALFDERSLYRRGPEGWRATHSRPEPWLSLDGPTPHLLGETLFHHSSWSGWNIVNLADPELVPDDRDYLQHCEAMLRPYYGPWANHCHALEPAGGGGVWMTVGFRHHGTLMRLDPDGSIALPVFAGSVDWTPVYDEGLLQHRALDADARARQIPVTAVAERDGVLWLAGELGISSVRAGRVEPLLRFTVTDPDRVSGASVRGPDDLVVFGDRTRPSFALARTSLALVQPSAEGWTMRWLDVP